MTESAITYYNPDGEVVIDVPNTPNYAQICNACGACYALQNAIPTAISDAVAAECTIIENGIHQKVAWIAGAVLTDGEEIYEAIG